MKQEHSESASLLDKSSVFVNSYYCTRRYNARLFPSSFIDLLTVFWISPDLRRVPCRLHVSYDKVENKT